MHCQWNFKLSIALTATDQYISFGKVMVQLTCFCIFIIISGKYHALFKVWARNVVTKKTLGERFLSNVDQLS